MLSFDSLVVSKSVSLLALPFLSIFVSQCWNCLESPTLRSMSKYCMCQVLLCKCSRSCCILLYMVMMCLAVFKW